MDNESVLTVDYVDKDELPPIEMAEHLVRCYMDTVQDVWPILTKSDFLNQFQHYSRSKNPLGLPVTWRAILNMVLAIGAKFSHLIGAPWRGDERDHLIYYTRAMHLAVPSDAFVAHPDLQRIQVVGLISFYYLTISQISRYVSQYLLPPFMRAPSILTIPGQGMDYDWARLSPGYRSGHTSS